MPVVLPAVRVGAISMPGQIPANAVSMRASQETFTFTTVDDFFAVDLSPDLGSNVFAGDVTVAPRFAGMSYHAALPTIAYGITRNVDCSGCHWADVEPGRGVYQWAALDAFVGTAAAAGRDIVYCLVATPAWASARPAEAGHYGNGSDAEPLRIDDVGEFAAAVCARYRALGTPITAFEIWNEPKYDQGGGVAAGNYFTGTPQSLAAMGRSIQQHVKAVDPQVLVFSPAPTGLEYPWQFGDGSGTDHLNSFLAAADGAGGTGRDWIDGVAFHAYSHDGYNNLYAIPEMLFNVQACLSLHGLSGRPIWITETSAITPPLASFTVEHQQAYVFRTLLLALGAGAARVVWYAWDDTLGFASQPAVATEWNRVTGLLAGARLTLVNSLRTKQVAAVVDGVRYLV